MLHSTTKTLMLTCLNLLKKEINVHDSDLYWPKSMKDTIWWFSLLAIMENTANVMKKKSGMIPSLLKSFAVF